MTVLDGELADPTGYGRIVRDDDGAVVGDRRAEGRHRRAARRSRDQLRHLRLRRRRSCATALGPARHRQRAGRGLPHRRRRDRASPTGTGSAPSSSPTSGQTEGVNDRVQLAELGRVLNDRMLERLDARRRHGRRPGHHLGRRRRQARARRRPAARHPAARHDPRRRRCRGRPEQHCSPTRRSARARRSSTRTSDGAVIGDRTRPSARSPTCGRAPGWARGAKAARSSRSRTADVGDGAKVPHLSYVGDADDRRGHQHRRRHDLRQLRRGRPSTAPRSGGTPRRQRHGARRAGGDRRRRLHRGRLRGDRPGRARASWPSPGARSATSRAGWPAGGQAHARLRRHRPLPRPRQRIRRAGDEKGSGA